MAQQQHSSELKITLDDDQALQALRALSETFARMQKTAQEAMRATGDAADRATPSTSATVPRRAKETPEEREARRQADREQRQKDKEARDQTRREERQRERETRNEERAQRLREQEERRRVEREARQEEMDARRQAATERQQQREATKQEERAQRLREQEAERRVAVVEAQKAQASQQALQASQAAVQAVVAGNGAGLLSAGAQGLGAGLTRLGAGREGRVGSTLRGLGAGLPVVGGLVGAALEARMARVGDVMGLERPQTELAIGGGYTRPELFGARATGAGLGFNDAQTVGLLQQFSRATQTRESLSAASVRDVLQSELSGVSAGALGGFAGGGALGGGARGGVAQELQTALRLSATGRAMGLSGAGVERLLAAVAQNTSRMAEQGLSLDTESFSSFVSAVSASARQLGARQVEGVGAVRAAGRVTGMAQGALGQVRGQFAGLGQASLLAAASRGARSPMELLANLEALSADPARALDAMRSSGMNGEALSLALAGGGASTAEARALLGAGTGSLAQGGLTQAEQRQAAKGMQFSTITATKDHQLTRMVESDPASVAALVKLNGTLEMLSLNMTKSDGAVIKAVEGVGAVMDQLLPAVDKLTKAANGLISFFGGRA